MAEYDANVIETFATKLYRKAALVQFAMTCAGTVGGLLFAGLVVNGTGPRIEPGMAPWVLLLLTGLGGLIGFAIGQSLAFNYKLQAQTALCQVQIEKNTRNANRSEAATAGK